jgi:DNA mismatch repair protein MutS
MGLESPQEAVKIIGDSLHSCELLREKSKLLNQDAPVAIKRNAIAKELMPSWMNYAHLYSGKEFLKELKNESHN